jgi:hypothetical protein
VEVDKEDRAVHHDYIADCFNWANSYMAAQYGVYADDSFALSEPDKGLHPVVPSEAPAERLGHDSLEISETVGKTLA